MQPANAPSPPLNSWLVKCLIHRVRNFKCIFLKSLILYQLTPRGTFYFKEYSREIPETRSNQRPIMSWYNNPPKNRNILTSVTWQGGWFDQWVWYKMRLFPKSLWKALKTRVNCQNWLIAQNTTEIWTRWACLKVYSCFMKEQERTASMLSML